MNYTISSSNISSVPGKNDEKQLSHLHGSVWICCPMNWGLHQCSTIPDFQYAALAELRLQQPLTPVWVEGTDVLGSASVGQTIKWIQIILLSILNVSMYRSGLTLADELRLIRIIWPRLGAHGRYSGLLAAVGTKSFISIGSSLRRSWWSDSRIRKPVKASFNQQALQREVITSPPKRNRKTKANVKTSWENSNYG